MDLIFKRYSSPFYLLDNYIQFGGLADFIDYLIDEVSEENIYELWLHKVYDREYNEFRDQCYGIVAQEATNRSIDVDKVVANSLSVLDIIQPQEEGE